MNINSLLIILRYSNKNNYLKGSNKNIHKPYIKVLHGGKMNRRKRLGDMLIELNYITENDLQEALKIQKETGIAYLFIAHDLSMVKYISDKIGVLHLGHLVETGTTEEIFDNPIHPYTKSLLSAIPHPNPRVEKVRKSYTYDYKESGVDYTKGTEHLVDGTHYVLATDEEFEKWTKK